MSDRSAAQRTRRILLLSSLTGDDPEFLRVLNEQGTVRTVANVGEALAALRSETFDVVLASASDLPPLARAAVRLQTEPIFETIGHGVCLVDDEGRLVWANQKLSSYPDETVEAVRKACAELYHEFAAEPPQPDQPRSSRRDLSAGEFAFDLTVSPICGPDGQVARVVALLVDVTATRWLRKRIEAIETAGRELVRLEADVVAEMDVGERLQLLEDKIARYAHDLLHFDHFSVRLLDKQTCRLDTVVTLGLSEEVNALEIYALKEGNGITGYVAATGCSYLCADVAQDPHYLPGLQNARSSLAVPLLLHDQVIGVLSAESERVKAFTEDDRQVAEIFGRSIAVALHTLQLLAVERHTAAGQIASDAAAELSGPLSNILVQANALIEQYPDDDNVRQRSQAVVEGVERVKQALAAMSEQPAINGVVPEQTSKDPLLSGKRILVADDEDIIRETIADVLSRNGVLTATARDGDEAVELIRSQSFDLVLSDIKMPHRNGYEVFAVTRQVNSQCPVILITGFGYDPNHSIVRASKEGLAGVLFKPFKVEKLLEEVRHALGAPAN